VADEWLDLTLTSPGPWGSDFFEDYFPADSEGQVFFDLYMMCPECIPVAQPQGVPGYLVVWGDWQPADYGEWRLQLDESAGKVEGEFYFAENLGVCQAMEFVPEPGTIILLGSGLAGLAGYATLRLRSGQALRWRARG
jgi:hypothetical protein